jgi:hypothetical protein
MVDDFGNYGGGLMGIAEILMERDGIERWEADNLVDEAQTALDEYLADGDISGAGYVCEEYFGLEPDCLDELTY